MQLRSEVVDGVLEPSHVEWRAADVDDVERRQLAAIDLGVEQVVDHREGKRGVGDAVSLHDLGECLGLEPRQDVDRGAKEERRVVRSAGCEGDP